jgi:hypothetical protein
MSMKVTKVVLADEGDVLATRARGRTLGRAIVDNIGDTGHLILDFNGVDVAAPTFLDELLVALRAVHLTDKGRLVVAVGLTPDVSESLEMVLERRKWMMAAMKDEEVALLGGQRQLSETLAAAARLEGPFTAPQLADELGIKLPALHQRLKALVEDGILAREVDTSEATGPGRRAHAYVDAADLIDVASDARRLQQAG